MSAQVLSAASPSEEDSTAVMLTVDDRSSNECLASQQGGAGAEGGATMRKLFAAIFICCAFMLIELVGGFLAGSLAIMTDAAHLLIDLAGFLISLVTLSLSKRAAKTSMSWGYRRAEILGALFSLFLVWALTFYLVVEACMRIVTPVPIDGRIMLGVSLIGVFGNVLMIFALHTDHHHSHGPEAHDAAAGQPSQQNINVRAALIHALGDLIQSLGVVVASICIWYRPDWHLADPICTFLFSIIVLCTTYSLAREVIFILMEAAPRDLQTSDLAGELASIKGVSEVHDLHVWCLSARQSVAITHLVVDWAMVAAHLPLYQDRKSVV